MGDTQSVSIEIPENLSDIKLSAYKKFILLANEENGDELALYYFCGLTPAQQEGMKKNDLDLIRNQIGKVLGEKPNLVKTFAFKGKEYGFHPKLEDISMGEYIDLDEYLKDPYKNAERILGVLYRPITKKAFGRHAIENYDPDVHHGEGFEDLSADIFLGCLLFFYRIATNLQITFLTSLEKEEKKDMINNLTSLKSGDGMEQYIKLLKEISYNLRK
tara:strand:+ start:12435 stop:13085 length:651 start_codon:yes stop_codon:yes gene_type:complete